MNRRLLEAAAVVVLLLGAIWAASAWGEARARKGATQHDQEAAQAAGEAKATRAEAVKEDAHGDKLKIQAAVTETAKQRADANGATADRELAKLRAGLRKRPPVISEKPGADPGTKNAASVEGVGQLQAIIEAQEKVHQADLERIATRDAEHQVDLQRIESLTISRDQWKATAQHLQDQADAQALAAAEWRKAVGAGERRAGIKWGLIGVGVGFLAGRH